MLHKLKCGTHKQGGKIFVAGDVVDLSPTAAIAFKDKFERYEEQLPLVPETQETAPSVEETPEPALNEPPKSGKGRKGNR